MPSPDDKSLARSLGEFFGHIWKGVTHDPKSPAAGNDRVRVREQREEEVRETPQGKVTIRRTIIEEVDLPTDQPAPNRPDPSRPSSDRPGP